MTTVEFAMTPSLPGTAATGPHHERPGDHAASAGLLTLDAAGQELLFRAARTANTFTDEPVTEEQVQAIHDLVRYGPTAMNAQPLRVVLVRSPEGRARLLPHVSAGNRAKTATAPLVAVLAADIDWHDRLPEVFPHEPEARSWFVGQDDRRVEQARLNATLQIGYLLVGVRAAGLAAGPMAGFDVAGVEREFFPDGRHRVLLLMNIGRPGPAAWQERLPRLSYDDVVRTV